MPVSTNFIAACAVGIAAHAGLFIRGEWHMQAPTLLVFHVAFGVLIVLFEVRKEDFSPSPLINASVIIGGYLLGLFSSIVLYRVSPFHRLRKFPGPRLAAVSKFWHVWQCRDSRNHELMERMHGQYGEFVRIGMIKILKGRHFRIEYAAYRVLQDLVR